ncbi:MAG: DUF3604 domain-containing protein [Deltaproteobacteria bacterium]
MKHAITRLIFATILLGAAACEQTIDLDKVSPLGTGENGPRYPVEAFSISHDILETRSAPNPERNAYFGDLHVHTTYSFDAFAFGTTATPRDAYRYALGETIQHPAGFDLKLREPLDFYAVTDHALFLGLAAEAADTSSEFSKYGLSEPLHNLNADDNRGISTVPGRLGIFGKFVPSALAGMIDGSVDREEAVRIKKSAWRDIVESADEFYMPGRFTTFAAYEYTTSSDDRGNLHRNVIFRATDRLPAEPFSRFNSQNPEGLWDWMDGLRARGIESLAIPHNSNGSNGQMFKIVDWAGNPMDDAYKARRLRNEPLVEITQVKGTSETHPTLSKTDEWADFEIMPYRVATTMPSEPKGSYVRDALRQGIAFADQGSVNPYKFGFIGSSDTHTGAISDDEANYFSKVGLLDASGELRGSVPLAWWQAPVAQLVAADQLIDLDGRTYFDSPTGTFGASGLAAVWAEENTREAIYDAFRRKETFATSGPRIRIRFFAGYDLGESLLSDHRRVAAAYAGGVPMGQDLLVQETRSPGFLAWATRDALSAPLQRLQIIKGWIENGTTFEEVYDIACSDGLVPDAKTHRCPDNGARVDIDTCAYSQDRGASELSAFWHDPSFDPAQRAFYYVRVLENPTCRWSTWDALRAGSPPRPDWYKTLQERAWSSPIWIEPAT